MNILMILVLVILLFGVFEGYRKGFLKTVFSLVSWIVVLVLCNVVTPMLTQVLIEKTDAEIIIQGVLDAKIEEMLNEAMTEVGGPELSQGVTFEIPEELQAALPEGVREELMLEGLTMLGNSLEGNAASIIDTAEIAERVVGMFALMIVLLLSKVFIVIINIILDVASKLPLIGPLDKVLGLVCGAGKGIIWCWIILTVVSILALTGINTEWALYISQSEFLMWLQNNNMILNLMM